MSRWTPDQERAIYTNGSNIIVSAGAGSGKTAVLTERTIEKVLNGTNINRLLILTFTKLAANEMKERIRAALKKNRMTDQLNLIDSAYITTFDSFTYSLLKKYHMYFKVSKDISIMDSSIEVVKTNEILDSIFEESYNDDNFKLLIDSFCDKNDSNIKGYLKDIFNKIDLIIDKENYLNTYIDIHFSNEYIEEYVNKYLNLINTTKDKIASLYYELGNFADNEYLESMNMEALINSKTYDDIKKNSDIKATTKRKGIDEEGKVIKKKIYDELKYLKDLTRFVSIEDIKNSITSTKPYIEAIINIKIKFDNIFSKYKKETNMYTYTDISKMVISMLKENNDIKEEIKCLFDEIMVDEYQDTSDIQEELINLISNNNVYMVGDIKQSIYRFRNANPYIFKNKYFEYSKNNGGVKIDLLKNFRSREEVLNNINLIFNPIMDMEVGDADYRKSHQMNYGNTMYEELKANQDYNMNILNYEKQEGYNPDEIEAFITAYDIKEKIESKFQVIDRKTRKLRNCTYSDFSIIMDRGTSFDTYKKIFEYLGMPLDQIKNQSLTLGDDLIIFNNLIKLIIKINKNELDDEFKYLYLTIARSYLYRISDEEIFDIIKENKYTNTELYNMCKIEIDSISILDLINIIIDRFDFYNKLITIENIKEVLIKIDYLKDLSVTLSNAGYTVDLFSEYLDEIITQEESIDYEIKGNNSDSVKILNIHKSKGLEYSICYFTGLYKKFNDGDKKQRFVIDSNYNIITPYIDDGIKQNIYKDLLLKDYDLQNISERIRLFYVALTRTCEKFILVCPIDKKDVSYDIVPTDERLNINSIKKLLDLINDKLEPYIIDVDFNKVKLSNDYKKIKRYEYKNLIGSTNDKIINHENKIEYKPIKEEKYSKNINKLITNTEYENMKLGTKLHYIFEIEDFNTTTNKYVLNFLNIIDKNYINVYKEYEFIYNDTIGIIDLILEYDNHIDIIDYKTKNVVDEAYINQLTGYKNYIKSISQKKVNTYLYSIVDDKLENITL